MIMLSWWLCYHQYHQYHDDAADDGGDGPFDHDDDRLMNSLGDR